VYSFGVVLWELWTGREPYEGLNYHALLHQITTSNGALRPPLPGKARWDGEVPPEPAPGWSDLCERCWGEDPALRPEFEEVRPAPRRRRPPPVSPAVIDRQGAKNAGCGCCDLPAAVEAVLWWRTARHYGERRGGKRDTSAK